MKTHTMLRGTLWVIVLTIGLTLLVPAIRMFAAALPQSCQDVLANSPGAPDGHYVIFPNNMKFTVYCDDMAGTPREYLTLVNTNFSQYTAGGASPGTNVRTDYAKVRLNPTTLVVDIGDQTFTSSTGSLNHGGSSVTSMPYGVAMACVMPFNAAGVAKIDLTGTPFAVNDSFILGGFLPGGTTTFSSNNQVVNLTGGGFCGWNQPAPFVFNPFNASGGFQLELAFIDSDNDGITDTEDLCPDTIIPEIAPTVRLGVNRFALTASGDGFTFDTTTPRGQGPLKSFTLADTAGCSCAQIIQNLGLGQGHEMFSCSISAMEDWINLINTR